MTTAPARVSLTGRASEHTPATHSGVAPPHAAARPAGGGPAGRAPAPGVQGGPPGPAARGPRAAGAQTVLLVVVFTPAPPHRVVPPAQVHVPGVHVWPAGHAVPHAPQFALSVAR